MKIIALIIAASISAVNGYVSWSVMSGIMVVYGVVAVAFECAKPFLIWSTAKQWRAGDTNRAFVAGCVAFALSCASVFCSVSMLESGVNTLKTESTQYAATSKQIDRLSDLAEKQRAAGYITKSAITETKIAELTASLPALTAETVVTQNSLPIAVGVSVMCELVVAAVLLCAPSSSARSGAGVHIENMTNNIQVNTLVHVRASILNGDTRPSFRGVADRFDNLRREDVRKMFDEMFNAGELVRHGKGYKLA